MNFLKKLSRVEDFQKNIEVLSDKNCNCYGCVECCTVFLPVSKQELKFLKGKSNLIKDRLQEIKENFDKGIADFTCPFINKSGGCLIYNDRPFICKNFHCNSKFRTDLTKKGIPFMTHLLIELYPKKLQEKIRLAYFVSGLGGEIDENF